MSIFSPRSCLSAVARAPRTLGSRAISTTPRLLNTPSEPVSSIPSLSSFAGSTTSRDAPRLSTAQSSIATSFLRNALPSANASASSSSSTEDDPSTSATAESWWRSTYAHRSWPKPGNQYTGRSVPVSPRSGDQGVSVAVRRLSGILTRNRVKRELKLGEYYEKPSERKKRLAVERHRRRFQDLVRHKIELVQAIRNRS
ncbi:hypothetical protein NliqN6_6136 [Naganishia liquefaciens]|uniref:Ribosomal protein S21 n=1 Tax=Naganishia liquefaciens TaxID=104408 RepID=A0A8H3U0V4_9TREE|nr:hypothetical protein NliqN6_6136 [Naganishia liquefaciens]